MAYPISNVYRRVQYTGSAGVGPYSFSFEILSNTDISVYKNQTLLTLTTDYTVTINANGTGSVTLVSAATAADDVTIYGSRAIERTSDFVTGGDLFANTLNDELDSLVIFTQQNKEEISRALMAPVTDPTTIDLTLPGKDDRAGYVLSFNDTTGDPEVTTTVADINQASTYAANALASQNAAAVSAAAALVSQGAAATSASAASASASAAAASVNGGMYSAVQDKSANYTVVAADAGDLIRVDTSAGPVTITLPTIGSAGIDDGYKVAVVKWTNDANAVTVQRASTNTINGVNTYSIGSQYTSATFVADAETGQWFGAASGVGTANIVSDVFSGTGSQTSYTLSGDPGSKNNTFVYVGGVYQQKSTYTQTGSNITFSAAPPSGSSNIEIIWIQPQAIGVPSDGSVSLAKLSATGTPSSLTFLRGDNTWATPPAGFSGATINAISSSPITLTYTSNQYQVCQISSYSNSYITLPDATTMLSIGSNPFVIENRSPYGANLEIRNFAGTVVGYVPIGSSLQVQLLDKSTSAGQWRTGQKFFNFDSASITSSTNTPVASNGDSGIVGLTSTTFVRWWFVTTYSSPNTVSTLYTQVGTISGSTITFGSIQNLSVISVSTGGSGWSGYTNGRVVRLSNTAFAMLIGQYAQSFNTGCAGGIDYAATQRIMTNTVSGTTVTFGTPSAASMPTLALTNTFSNVANSVFNNGTICRVSDTVFALCYNDAVSNTYTHPYNYQGSMACQIVSVSGTTQTIGTKVQLGTSTYSQVLSMVGLSATSVFLAYSQATATGGTVGRTKLVVISVSGTTPTFNTPVSCEASDVACFITLGTTLTSTLANAAVAPSATQVVFNSGYNIGECTISGTTPTFDSFPYPSRIAPIWLSTSSRAFGQSAYLDIVTGGFVTYAGVTDVLQTNLSVTAATPFSPLGAQPTTAFVAYKDGAAGNASVSTIILGSTT